ncbi:hypothetical protein [Aureibaculum conchae]|uniref:hypothetical protein n=1 Tax=Aureibaculum sp. 2308TA14-22 TaxID=3108392 RepID=UPI0033982EE3
MKKVLLYLALLLFILACNADNDTIEIPKDNDLIIGVNTQRVFQTKFHPGLSEDQIIDRVASLINQLKFNSIRIGGTASFGGTFDTIYKGFGWAKYNHIEEVRNVHPNDYSKNEPFNYNVIALKMAQKANVSVWIDLHRYMTDEDIDYAMQLVKDYGVTLAGVTRDNEPYVPEREEHMEAAYQEFTDSRFRNFSWPAMSVIAEGQGNDRANRESRCIALVNQYRANDESIEIHSYVPREYTGTPKQWIQDIINDTKQAYNVTNDQIMLGEWSGKNQENFSDDEIEKIISDYLEVLQKEKIASYYQVLGTDFDEVGLYNFEKD